MGLGSSCCDRDRDWVRDRDRDRVRDGVRVILLHLEDE
jgi:hypothetical protein